MFEIAVLRDRHLQRKTQQRDGSQHLHQRRVFRIQPEIGMLPGHVAGVDVIVLVPRDRVLPHGQGKLQKQHDEERKDSSRDPDVLLGRFDQGASVLRLQVLSEIRRYGRSDTPYHRVYVRPDRFK